MILHLNSSQDSRNTALKLSQGFASLCWMGDSQIHCQGLPGLDLSQAGKIQTNLLSCGGQSPCTLCRAVCFIHHSWPQWKRNSP